jgi:hypothetical protein
MNLFVKLFDDLAYRSTRCFAIAIIAGGFASLQGSRLRILLNLINLFRNCFNHLQRRNGNLNLDYFWDQNAYFIGGIGSSKRLTLLQL